VFLLDKSGCRHHIGLYAGDGAVIEAKGTAYGVVTSKLSHWDEWGELKAVEYGEASEGEGKTMRTIKRGNTGADVETLQTALVAAGQIVTVDGKFGAQTRNAVLAVQQKNGLTPDGIVGPLTWAALGVTEKTESAEKDETGQTAEAAGDKKDALTILKGLQPLAGNLQEGIRQALSLMEGTKNGTDNA
jgi:hypothetical protein